MSVSCLANLASEYMKYTHHVSEVYSPPRVAKLAHKLNLSPGFSIDLREIDPYDGKPWDLSLKEKRDRVRERVESEKPLLLIGCPPCTVFSSLFMSNISRMNMEEVRAKIKDAVIHLRFCIMLYKIQIENGRFFFHEHPWQAWS